MDRKKLTQTGLGNPMKKFKSLLRIRDKTTQPVEHFPNTLQVLEVGGNNNIRKPSAHLINGEILEVETFNILSKEMKSKDEQAKEDNYKDQLKKKYHKIKMSPEFFQKELYSIVVEHIYENSIRNGEIDVPKLKVLLRVAEKANISKNEINVYKWIIYTKIFNTCGVQCYESILNLIIQNFDSIVNILEQNHEPISELNKIWTTFEILAIKLTDIVTGQCNEIIDGSFSPETDTILSLLGSLSDVHGKLQKPEFIALNNLPVLIRKLKTMFSASAEKMFRLAVKPDSTQSVLDGILQLTELLIQKRGYWKNVFTKNGIKIDLYELIYSVWDYKIFTKIKTILQESLHVLHPIQFQDEFPVISTNLDFSHELLLFELYKALNIFSSLTDSPGLPHLVHIKGSFHELFRPFVTQWLDIMCYKGIMQIENAVQLDTLRPITQDSKISSSAVETIGILETMKISWKELEWPDYEEGYTFALLALKNFDHCIKYYVGSIYNRVQVVENQKFEQYEISDEICIALNNVGYIKEQVHSIVTKFSVTDIISKLSNERDPNSTAMEQCRNSVPNLVESWTDNVNRQMLKNLSSSCSKVEPLLHLYIEAGFYDQSLCSSDQFVTHLQGILEQMNTKLTTSEFHQAFPIVWNKIFDSFLSFTEKKLKCYQNEYSIIKLEEMFFKLLQIFFEKEIDGLTTHPDYSKFMSLKRTIELHKLSTQELILEYMEETYRLQNTSESLGKISILSHYCEVSETLNVKILNASLPNLGCVNSYVKFRIHKRNNPVEDKHSTKVKKKTDHPIFEEKFFIKFPLQEFISGGYIQFWIKEEVASWGKFIGESFIPLAAVPLTNTRVNIDDLIQIKLPIIRPSSQSMDFDVVEVLKIRKTLDKEALKFLNILQSRTSKNTRR